MSQLPARSQGSSPVRLLAHMVRSALGVRTLRVRTVLMSVLALVVGLPLLGAVVENLVTKTWADALALLLVSLALCVSAWLLLRRDVRQEALLQRDLHNQPAGPCRALILACSLPVPTDEQLSLLSEADHHHALTVLAKGLNGRKNWVELLARAVTFHAPTVERVILLVDREHYKGDRRGLIERAVADWLLGTPGRTVTGARVELLDLPDPNDAELVRSRVLGAIAELKALGVAPAEVAVCISTGTAAITVGMALAAALVQAEVQYFPQVQRPQKGDPGFGSLEGVAGALPVRVPTGAARLDFEAVAFEG